MKYFLTLLALTGSLYSQASRSREPDCIVHSCRSDAGSWSGYGRDPQHTATAAQAAQNLNAIHWQTPVDLNPPGG